MAILAVIVGLAAGLGAVDFRHLIGLQSIYVKDVMNPEAETIPEDLTLRKLAEKISKSKYNNFPVINKEGNLIPFQIVPNK